MIRKKKKVDTREIIKKAYTLGFEVGYYRHYESVGWVRKKREEIEELAEKFNLTEEVRKAYARGKADGERKRSRDMLEERNVVDASSRKYPTRGLEAISYPRREPRFFHIPKFLRRSRR